MKQLITLAAAVALSVEYVAVPSAQPSLFFPSATGAWEVVSEQSIGFDRPALDAALAYAGTVTSSGVVILHNGRLLSERHWPTDANAGLGRTAEGWAIEDVASMQKSVVAILVGVAIERRLLDRNAPVTKYLGTGWSKAAPDREREITIDHLLTMTSGLDNALAADAAVGTKWFYNTPAYSRLIRVLESVTHKEPNAYLKEFLGDRIGLRDTKWIARGPALANVNPFGLATTARDMARVGLLVHAGGRWRGERVVNESYVRAMTATSQSLNPSYGLLWYINRPVPRGLVPFLNLPFAPADLMAAQGAGQRRIYVVPSLGLVAVRLGAPVEGFDNEFVRKLLQAAPRPRG